MNDTRRPPSDPYSNTPSILRKYAQKSNSIDQTAGRPPHRLSPAAVRVPQFQVQCYGPLSRTMEVIKDDGFMGPAIKVAAMLAAVVNYLSIKVLFLFLNWLRNVLARLFGVGLHDNLPVDVGDAKPAQLLLEPYFIDSNVRTQHDAELSERAHAAGELLLECHEAIEKKNWNQLPESSSPACRNVILALAYDDAQVMVGEAAEQIRTAAAAVQEAEGERRNALTKWEASLYAGHRVERDSAKHLLDQTSKVVVVAQKALAEKLGSVLAAAPLPESMQLESMQLLRQMDRSLETRPVDVSKVAKQAILLLNRALARLQYEADLAAWEGSQGSEDCLNKDDEEPEFNGQS